MHVTPALLEAAAMRPLPNKLDRPLYEACNAYLPAYGIDTPLRVAHWLAQAAHETAGFARFTEVGGASYFTRNYEGRADLGNTQPGDGVRYKGRGIFMLTGRANYREFGAALGMDLEGSPELAADLEGSVKVAGLYWQRRNINAKADADDITGVTRKINGGKNGLADREARLRRIKAELRLA